MSLEKEGWNLQRQSMGEVKSESVSCSVVPDSATPWTVAHQGPLAMGFSGQEYWGGSLCPPPGDLPDPGTEPKSLRFLTGRQIVYH